VSVSRRYRLGGAVMAIALAAMTLAGCGGDSKSNGGSGAKTLVVWDPFSLFGAGTPQDQANLESLTKLLDDQFKQSHPNLTIKHAHYNYDGYQTRLAAAVAAGAAPDIAWDYGDLQWQLTDPLDARMSADQKADLTLVDQSVVSAADRKLHVLPIGTYQGAWLYNKALFSRAGISVPTTQQQWLANCDKLNAAGIRPTQVSFARGHKLDRYAALFAGQLITNIDKWNDGSMPYTSAEYRQGVQAVLDGLQHGCWGKDPQAAGTPGDSDSTFLAGQTAINFATSNIDVKSIESKIGKGNLGVFLQPVLPGGAGPSMDASLEYGMTLMKTSKNKDLAWQYMSLWASPQGQQLAWEKIGQIPNSKTAKATGSDPVNEQLLSWAKESNPQFHVGAWPISNQESDTYTQIAPSVITGRVSVDSFLNQMQKVRVSSRSGG
jgi:raffinose/stachyose/melibiose transport system substrate-binding protein